MKLTSEENRELAEYLGICWHEQDFRYLYSSAAPCSCGKVFNDRIILNHHAANRNPNFSDARVVLREMMKREDYLMFIKSVGIQGYSFFDHKSNAFIKVDYILDETDGLLARAALEWMRKQAVQYGYRRI